MNVTGLLKYGYRAPRPGGANWSPIQWHGFAIRVFCTVVISAESYGTDYKSAPALADTGFK